MNLVSNGETYPFYGRDEKLEIRNNIHVRKGTEEAVGKDREGTREGQKGDELATSKTGVGDRKAGCRETRLPELEEDHGMARIVERTGLWVYGEPRTGRMQY